jgi:hypothetical protein
MTSLTDMSKLAASGDKLPSFAFKRIGDAVKGTIIRSAQVQTEFGGVTKDKFVIELDVLNAKGGKPQFDSDDMLIAVEDFTAGEQCAVWSTPNMVAAIVAAVKDAGGTELSDGGTLTVTLTEKKDTGKAKPLGVYSAAYVAPVGGTSVADLSNDPF